METHRVIRIGIVEDHLLFRVGLRLILDGEKSLEIVGEAANGFHAIEMIDNLEPDIVLLDINMPELDGFQLLRIMKQKGIKTRPLMLTASVEETKIIKSLCMGAKGYLSKNTSPEGLIKAIKAVHNGQLWVERNLMARYFNGACVDNEAMIVQLQDSKAELTQREHDVLRLLTKGLSNQKIAKQLFISEKTVKSHLYKIYKKLQVTQRLEAILYAIKLGIA